MNPTGVLITGGAGFIGSHLAEHYLKQSIPVVCVDNFCTGLRANATLLANNYDAHQFQFIEADVIKKWDWSQISNFKENGLLGKLIREKRLSHVFHFASPASPPLYQAMAFETMAVNTVGLQNAIDFADTQGARVIFASTSEVYGDPSCHPQPESYFGNVNSFGIRSCYDEAKRFGETIIFTHNWKKKTKHGLVRIFNTYGPRMNPSDGRVVINFLMQASRGEDLTVYGTGEQTRSFCYISDLVAGITIYAKSEIFEPVNIGNDKEFTINELVHEVQKLNEKKELKVSRHDLPKDDPTQRRPCLKKAKSLLNPWEPVVPLSQGLKLMNNWIEQ